MEQILFNILLTASVYLIVSQSFLLIYQTAKFFNVAHAAIISLGGYITYTFSKILSFNIVFSIVIGVILSVLVGIAIELFIFKKLRKNNIHPYMLLIASLGIYIIINNIILIIWGAQTNIIRSSEVEVGNQFISAYITDVQLVIIICVFLFIFFTRFFINQSNIGKQIKAVSSNPELANIFGINSNKIILLAFAIGSTLAAVTGVLVAFDTDLTPNMGFNLLLYGIVAMIIGGVGNFYGLIGGSLLLSATQHIGTYYFDGKWMDAIAFIILILFLLWKPLGLSGNKLKKTQI